MQDVGDMLPSYSFYLFLRSQKELNDVVLTHFFLIRKVFIVRIYEIQRRKCMQLLC